MTSTTLGFDIRRMISTDDSQFAFYAYLLLTFFTIYVISKSKKRLYSITLFTIILCYHFYNYILLVTYNIFHFMSISS